MEKVDLYRDRSSTAAEANKRDNKHLEADMTRLELLLETEECGVAAPEEFNEIMACEELGKPKAKQNAKLIAELIEVRRSRLPFDRRLRLLMALPPPPESVW